MTTYANKGLATRAANKQGLAKGSYEIVAVDDRFEIVAVHVPTKAEQHALDVAARKAEREARKAEKLAAKAEALAKRLAEPKVTALPVKASTVEKPVDVARAFIVKNMDKMTRKAIILHLVNNVGLNRNMVQTRYSWVKSGKDPMFKAIAREQAAKEAAAQAKAEAKAEREARKAARAAKATPVEVEQPAA